MSERYFHFMIGPVQDFISQARRNRDFWAGSFLLSWLSAIAIREAEKQGAKILYPAHCTEVMDALNPASRTGPKQARLPSRFKAEINDEFDPELVIQAARQAWSTLAKTIYSGDLEHFEADYPKMKAIWHTQIDQYWDFRWAITSDKTDETVLQRTKLWRKERWTEQDGVKCMVMDGWRELSGAESPLYPDNKVLAGFWETLRNSKASGISSDLRENEHLCALAFMKRRFSRYFNKIEHGWGVPNTTPSADYLAAASWLAKMIRKTADNAEAKESLSNFYQLVQKLEPDNNMGSHPATKIELKCIKDALDTIDHRDASSWVSVDAGVFFSSNLLASKRYKAEDEGQQALKVNQQLSQLRKTLDMPEPTPFYAVLRMDGDNMTKEMANPNNDRDAITHQIGEFNNAVPEIVEDHSGFLVYSGGDDVLALFPMEYALDAALALRTRYQTLLPEVAGQPMTISAAIIFAHTRVALTTVLRESHHLLDDVAKSANRRDAIAVSVLKTGGEVTQWVQQWNNATNDSGLIINQLVALFRNKQQADSQFSSKFFYKIRERFEALNPQGESTGLFREQQAVDLMTMEYLNSWGRRSGKADEFAQQVAEAKHNVALLMNQCRVDTKTLSQAEADTNTMKWKEDAALLVRFLAENGVSDDE